MPPSAKDQTYAWQHAPFGTLPDIYKGTEKPGIKSRKNQRKSKILDPKEDAAYAD